ncbi:MAG: threonine ammonia-lyase [Deltaproteobacteria bacterium]|nr:threonine ammonia-lyase [Deltaproteobacteria bacterium]
MTTLQHIQEAAEILKDRVLRTPLVHSPYLSRHFGAQIYLKLENLQNTGSFKVRGAVFKLFSESQKRRLQGVVAASAGNHAQGVALAARQARVNAIVVMPEWASISKQEATRAYGGKVVISGKTVDESLKEARKLAGEGRLFIHPFDDPLIITGQGTIGLEILEDLRNPDKILVPVGGGGLAAGIGIVVKAQSPRTRVIGVQSTACPSARESLRLQRRVMVDAAPSLADGIAVRQTGKRNYRILASHLDDLVTVNESSIAAAILMLLEKKKILAEGAGAVPLAALLEKSVHIKQGDKVVLVISGGNMDSSLIGRIISQQLIQNARVMRMTAVLEDVPGTLATLLSQVAALKANVLHIRHDRNVGDLPINMSRVAIELETRGEDHVKNILHHLRKAGYNVRADPVALPK